MKIIFLDIDGVLNCDIDRIKEREDYQEKKLDNALKNLKIT